MITIDVGNKTTSKGFRAKTIPINGINPQNGALKEAEDKTRFTMFWDLMAALEVHGYIRSAMSVIGRSAVGTGWSVVRHDEFGTTAREGQRRRLLRFYTQPVRKWDNIKDYQSISYKLMIGIMYLKFFGQAAYRVIRNPEGTAVGFEHLPGFVMPNVDKVGYFKSPAFYQYPTSNPKDRVEIADAKDVIFITTPDWRGRPYGSSDMESVAEFALPIDLYLQGTARSYLGNRDRPEAVYILPSDTSDEAFETFSEQIRAKYAGPKNVGTSPITVAGDFDIKELSPLPKDLPYEQGRKETRKELLAAASVSEPKMGLTDGVSNSNFRELRREFHETSMIPLFRIIESALYEQVHQREFGIDGWSFQFNAPDFLTLLERATVDMRYYQANATNPNEMRKHLGLQSRGPQGDKFLDELNRELAEATQPEESTTPEEDDPASDDGDETIPPERGDGHDDYGGERALTSEIRQWKRFAVKRMKSGRSLRAFSSAVIPQYLIDAIQGELSECKSVDDVYDVFNEIDFFIRERENE